ncbi:hypothetical protein JVU11DRAFT_3442 [Chiua virens]|nr:hypothetical protein JVU11DRAFT_3442 [Chiua virens]
MPSFVSEGRKPYTLLSLLTAAPESAPVPPKKKRARHPYRVYGYKVTHEWVYEFGRKHGIEREGMSLDTLESLVFLHLIHRLPGLQHHFFDDKNDIDGWSHILTIANNWNPKKKPLVAGRLPTWKAILGTEEEPRWYIPSPHNIPPIPLNYRKCVAHVTNYGILTWVFLLLVR